MKKNPETHHNELLSVQKMNNDTLKSFVGIAFLDAMPGKHFIPKVLFTNWKTELK